MTRLNEQEKNMYNDLLMGRRPHIPPLAALVHTVMEDRDVDASLALKHVLKLCRQLDELHDRILDEQER